MIRTVLAAAIALASLASAARAEDSVVARPVQSEKLPNVPGKSITAVQVNYAPAAPASTARPSSGCIC